MHDIRCAFRPLLKSRGFTAIAVLTIAIAIGATTSIFRVISAVLLRPLAYPEPRRLMTVWPNNPRQQIDKDVTSGSIFDDWRCWSGFAGLTFLLAVIGLYGLIAYSVARRRHEFGIRVALGAPRSNVVTLVVRQALVLVGAGVVAGLAGAWFATRASLLVGVTPTDPLTYVVMVTLLVAAAILASVVPAAQATRVDPVVALRD